MRYFLVFSIFLMGCYNYQNYPKEISDKKLQVHYDSALYMMYQSNFDKVFVPWGKNDEYYDSVSIFNCDIDFNGLEVSGDTICIKFIVLNGEEQEIYWSTDDPRYCKFCFIDNDLRVAFRKNCSSLNLSNNPNSYNCFLLPEMLKDSCAFRAEAYSFESFLKKNRSTVEKNIWLFEEASKRKLY